MPDTVNVFLEYIWIDNNNGLRSKTKVHPINLNNLLELKPEFLPEWNYDGSSTNQASGVDSEVILKPPPPTCLPPQEPPPPCLVQ